MIGKCKRLFQNILSRLERIAMKHFILFTGHMIDAKDRKEPRFPPYKEKQVEQEIYKHLLKQKQKTHDNLEGIASGACGGDIIFHEICAALHIPTQICLGLPAEEFKKESVSFAGEHWDRRFNTLIEKLPAHILSKADEKKSRNIYEMTNEWMLDKALGAGGKNMTLLALWNGDIGDGKGGTQHMVAMAKEQGAEVAIIDITKI